MARRHSRGGQGQRSLRDRYRLVVAVLIIPLGMVIVVRAAMVGWPAWTLMVLGLAFVGLGIVRLYGYGAQGCRRRMTLGRRKGA
jgi:uncharacterized membrane protein YecN with MAPEG domain